MSGVPTNKVRLYVLTASVAAITATGAWYGAGLKARQEFNQEKKRILQQTSIADRIEQMETVKAGLIRSRDELQLKIDRLTSKTENSRRSSG